MAHMFFSHTPLSLLAIWAYPFISCNCTNFGRRLFPAQTYFCAAPHPLFADLTCFPDLVLADSSGGSVREFVSWISDSLTPVYSSRNNWRFGLDHDDKATCFPRPASAGISGGSVTVNSSWFSALLVPVSSSRITWWLRRDHEYRTTCFPGLILAGLSGGSVFLPPLWASSRLISVYPRGTLDGSVLLDIPKRLTDACSCYATQRSATHACPFPGRKNHWQAASAKSAIQPEAIPPLPRGQPSRCRRRRGRHAGPPPGGRRGRPRHPISGRWPSGPSPEPQILPAGRGSPCPLVSEQDALFVFGGRRAVSTYVSGGPARPRPGLARPARPRRPGSGRLPTRRPTSLPSPTPLALMPAPSPSWRRPSTPAPPSRPHSSRLCQGSSYDLPPGATARVASTLIDSALAAAGR